MTLSLWLESWTELSKLYQRRLYADGAALAASMRERFPERQTQAAFFEACFLGVQGDGQGALRLLHETLEVGAWIPAGQLRDPDLDSARGAAFDEIATEMQRRYDVMLVQAREESPATIVVRPDVAPTGALLVLHTYTAFAEATAKLWERAAAAGFLLVVPQSTQRDGDDLPAWFDYDVALKDARAALEEADAGGIPLLLGGASQGARIAARMAIEGSLPDVRGFASVVSTAPDVDEVAYAQALERGVRAWLLAGERDGIRAMTEAFHADLAGRGFDARLEVAPGTGHDFPADFPARVARALAFLAG